VTTAEQKKVQREKRKQELAAERKAKKDDLFLLFD
jgi:hypothetical protein